MVAEAGVSLYRVVTVKRSGGETFVAVDGGMGDNLEVALYGQRFEATVATRVRAPAAGRPAVVPCRRPALRVRRYPQRGRVPPATRGPGT